MTDERMQIVMGLIMAGGNAKNCAVEAITAAKNGDFAESSQMPPPPGIPRIRLASLFPIPS